jgi:hypothetical protein
MNETPQQNQPPAQPPVPQTAPQQQPAPHTEPPRPQLSDPPHGSGPKRSKSPYLYALLTFILGIGVGYLLIVLFPGSKAAETSQDKSQIAKALQLPKDAVKVHECINQKGELRAVPKDLPQGPIYMVDKDKVIGLEYVLNKEVFDSGKIYDELNTLQAGVNHMQVASMSAGFDGIPGDYYVVDLYSVDKKAQETITCDVPSPTLPEASPSAEVSIFPSSKLSQPPVISPAVIISPAAPSAVPSL